MICEWCRQRPATAIVEVRPYLEIHTCVQCKAITRKHDPWWDRYLAPRPSTRRAS